MNEAEAPSTTARILARVLGIIQIILLGPITVASTVATSLLCCTCICLKFQGGDGCTLTAIQTFLSNSMSTWGLVWMILLFFLPLTLGFGGVAVGVVCGVVVASYPCYALLR